MAATEERRMSLRDQVAQRRRDMNVTINSTVDEIVDLDDSLNQTRMSNMAAKRQLRQKMLDESMGKSARLDEPVKPMEESTVKLPQTSSTNLSQSIRERLKDRVRKSQDTILTEEPRRKLKGLRNREHQNRFDLNSDTAVDQDISEDVSETEDIDKNTSIRWKILAKRSKVSKESIDVPIDAYSFFTKTYETSTTKSSVQADDEIDFTKFDSIVTAGSSFVPNHSAKDKLFVPSTDLAPEETFDGDLFHVEEEGIYIGEPPPVAGRIRNRMENRILKAENGKRWFGNDGNMIVVPNPLKQISTRPLISYSVDPRIQMYVRSLSTSQVGKYIDDGHVHQLSVHVGQLSFTHHPLFTREHVLVAQINDLYSQYVFRQTHNLTEHLEDRLYSLRRAINELKDTLGPEPWDISKPFISDCVENLREYCQEIRDVRELNDIECLKDKQMLINILKIWKEIKSAREMQGFIATSTKLLVFKEEVDHQVELEKWNNMLAEIIEEEKVGAVKSFKLKQSQYKNDLAEWKLKFKEMKKQSKEKNNTASETMPPRPKPPPKPSLKELRIKVEENAKRCHKLPGDPSIKVELCHSTPITLLDQCPVPEQKRRNDIPKTTYYGKLFYNNNEVTKLPEATLTPSFNVNFSETVYLQVVHWPESIKLELWDSSEKLTDIFLSVPPSDCHTGNTELESLEFSTNQKVAPSGTSAVGSNIANESDGKISLTSGKIVAVSAWVRTEDGKVLAPRRHGLSAFFGRADPVQYIGAKNLNDMSKVMQWIQEAKLDPNDPRNAPLLHLFITTSKESKSASGYFRLDALEKYTYFASAKDLDEDQRFQLICKRKEGLPEYKPLKMIPMFASEINGFQNRIEDEAEQKIALKEETNVFEKNRIAVSKYLTALQDKIAARSRAVKPVYEISDVVTEEQIPDIGTLGKNIAQLFEPRRPLRPQRKVRKKVTNQAVGVTHVDLLINVSQAHSLPIRKPGVVSGYGTQSPQITLRPYVEISFQRQVRTTHVEDGPNPQWNQEVTLPLTVPNNEYSTHNLRFVSDVVYFNVFDEIVVDILEDERLRETDIHNRRERRWLGSFHIPFSTIYINSRVEGKFKLNVPRVLLGYNKEHNIQPQLLQDSSSLMALPTASIDRNSYISIFITVEPPLAPQPPLREIFETTEDPHLINISALYEKDYKEKFPNRSISNLVSDDNGKSVFITRFISPQNPPAELIPEDTAYYNHNSTLRKIARFVSLIPYYQDSIIFAAKCDIWVTSELFLKMLAGDEEEHAVLLCNYFLFLGVDAYVVVGVGIPEGETCYVLTKINGHNTLWNPSTGDFYPQNNSYHALRSVHYAFNNVNIWANIQKYDEPDRINFTFNLHQYWKPFTRKMPAPLSTVQTSKLEYIPTNVEAIQSLQNDLEKTLTDKIMEWRDRHVTRWNRHCRTLIRSLLPRLEARDLTGEEQQNTLQSILDSYYVTGFPLNMRYKDLKSIIETVYSTNVHVSEDARAEFALAVYIHPFPNNVLSVWVYIAKLSRKG